MRLTRKCTLHFPRLHGGPRMRFPRLPMMTFPALAILAGCATAQPLPPPEVPAALRPPAGQSLYLEALATGVQIYECSQKPDSAYEWAFKAPEASLADRSGHSLGKHYAGPTWESSDGSTVVGEIQARSLRPSRGCCWPPRRTLVLVLLLRPRAPSESPQPEGSHRPKLAQER